MNTTMKRLTLWGVSAALAIAVFHAPAVAATSLTLDIRVSINATKSVSVGSTFYNYGALAVNVSSVSSAIVVTNDSNALVETYTLQGANATSTGGGTTWTLASSTGPLDTFALAAQFSTAQPANTDLAFATDDLTAGVIACTGDGSTFGNDTVGQAGYNVSPIPASRDRNLWFRIRTPLFVTDVTQRLAVVTLAVQ